MIEANSRIDCPSWGVSHGTPDLDQLQSDAYVLLKDAGGGGEGGGGGHAQQHGR